MSRRHPVGRVWVANVLNRANDFRPGLEQNRLIYEPWSSDQHCQTTSEHTPCPVAGSSDRYAHRVSRRSLSPSAILYPTLGSAKMYLGLPASSSGHRSVAVLAQVWHNRAPQESPLDGSSGLPVSDDILQKPDTWEAEDAVPANGTVSSLAKPSSVPVPSMPSSRSHARLNPPSKRPTVAGFVSVNFPATNPPDYTPENPTVKLLISCFRPLDYEIGNPSPGRHPYIKYYQYKYTVLQRNPRGGASRQGICRIAVEQAREPRARRGAGLSSGRPPTGPHSKTTETQPWRGADH